MGEREKEREAEKKDSGREAERERERERERGNEREGKRERGRSTERKCMCQNSGSVCFHGTCVYVCVRELSERKLCARMCVCV